MKRNESDVFKLEICFNQNGLNASILALESSPACSINAVESKSILAFALSLDKYLSNSSFRSFSLSIDFKNCALLSFAALLSEQL